MMDNILFALLIVSALSWNLASSSAQTKPGEKAYPVGPLSQDEVMTFNPEYRQRVVSYKPKRGAIDFLRHFSAPVTIEVFYGGWCSDSRDHVPSFIKVIEQADNPNFSVSFVAVDENKQEPGGSTQWRHIERVPTFVVSVAGREIGRIIETPKGTVEEHLVKILKLAARQPR